MGKGGRPLKRLRKSAGPSASATEEQGSSAIQAVPGTTPAKEQPFEPFAIDCASPSSEGPAQSSSHEPEAPDAQATSLAPSVPQRVPYQYVLPLFTACNGRLEGSSAAQERLEVGSRCSTDHDTWLAGGSILYPARLQATQDAEPAGDSPPA